MKISCSPLTNSLGPKITSPLAINGIIISEATPKKIKNAIIDGSDAGKRFNATPNKRNKSDKTRTKSILDVITENLLTIEANG